MTLGDRIKECRLKAKLSQEKVAELVGVSRQAVTKWESGLSAPNTDNLFKLAEVLGTTVDFLITAENDTRSVAEQVYQMIKDEAAGKEAEIRHQRLLNFYAVLGVLAGYTVIFLTGKLLFTESGDYTVLGWLTNTDMRPGAYLFGWLLSSRMFHYATILSMFCGLAGFRRVAFTTLGAFTLGLPLGEYLGAIPALVPQGYHYGWAIWGLLFIGSIFLGIWLQRFPAAELHWHSKKLRRWCIAAGLYAAASIAFVLLNIPPAYY
ncbi:MAG: helix-turn-helix transcriptional regulator [Oscillospiraceae bacterium]|nr:helix-turn-helix transcriptional regulator [Oscillospiraceae bacterium]